MSSSEQLCATTHHELRSPLYPLERQLTQVWERPRHDAPMLAAAATRAHGRRAQPLVAATEIHPPPHTSTSDPQAHSLPGTWLVYILSPNLHLDNHNAADVLHGPLRTQPLGAGPVPQ